MQESFTRGLMRRYEMEMVMGLMLGALLGFGVGSRAIKQDGDRQDNAACQQEAEPLEKQWQRLFAYEGHQLIREDEDD